MIRSLRSVAALALMLAVCGSVARGQAPDTTTIRIGAALDDETTPLVYGWKSGFFQSRGLNVEVDRFNSGSAVAAAVAGGSLEMGKAGTIAILQAHVRGLPFTLVAPVSYYRNEKPACGLIVPTASPLKSARDFEGKTISVSSIGDLFELTMSAWLEQNGVDKDSVKYVEIPPPTVTAAIDQGRIDGGLVCEPIFHTALSTGKYRMAAATYSAVGEHWQTAAIFAKTDWVDAHRDLVERFVRAVRDVNAYVNAHEDVAAPIIDQFIGLDPATVKNEVHPGRALYLVPDQFQSLIDVAAKYKAIARAFPAQELISPYALKPGAR
jgi:NitT/TauT family transport system substrate-binding protein